MNLPESKKNANFENNFISFFLWEQANVSHNCGFTKQNKKFEIYFYYGVYIGAKFCHFIFINFINLISHAIFYFNLIFILFCIV
jgi:hypothetical protein